MTESGPVDVIDWLLDTDPAIRWQVMRDLTREPVDVVAAERSKIATQGWGALLLALQGRTACGPPTPSRRIGPTRSTSWSSSGGWGSIPAVRRHIGPLAASATM